MSSRRSNRQSGISTPAEPAGPTFTASGRQVRSRVGGAYGESMLSGAHIHDEDAAMSGGDAAPNTEAAPLSRTRTRGLVLAPHVKEKRKHIEGYNALDDMEDESDASTSGGEWDGEEDDEIEDNVVDDDEDDDADMSESGRSVDELEELVTQPSLMVSLRYHPKHSVSDAGSNGFTAPPVESTNMVNGTFGSIANGNRHPSSSCRPSPLREMSSVGNSQQHTASFQGVVPPSQ